MVGESLARIHFYRFSYCLIRECNSFPQLSVVFKYCPSSLKYVTQVQQQRPESLTLTLSWHACEYKVQKLHQRYIHRICLLLLLYLLKLFSGIVLLMKMILGLKF